MNVDNKKLIIFDADGTLRRCTVPGRPCPNAPGEWELMPGVRERWANCIAPFVAIVSNQGGVGLGMMTQKMATSLLEDLAAAAFDVGKDHLAPEVRIYVCPHAPKVGCRCRKPSPFMLYQAMEGAGVTPAETLYVGDMDSDREAAQRAGVDFLWAWEFFGWEPVEGQATGGLLAPKNVSVAIKWDLGQGNEDAIFVRPKMDLLKVLQAPHGSKSAAAFLSQRKLTIPAGTFLAEYEVEGSMSSVDVAEQLNAEHGENFTVTAIFPTRIKVCTARSFTVNLDIANS